MRVVGLFDGIGGLSLGLKEAGHEHLLLCEQDPGCQQVLRKHFPGVPIYNDVGFLWSLPSKTELVAAGFPCIDVSKINANRNGLGESTGMVAHVFRLLRKAIEDDRPVQWVLLENVLGVLEKLNNNKQDPPVIKYILRQFFEMGYCSVAYRVLSTAGVTGLPNRRRRVFIVASWQGDARDVLLSMNPKCFGGCSALFEGELCYECHTRALVTEKKTPEAYCVDLANAWSAGSCSSDISCTFTSGGNKLLVFLPNEISGIMRIEDVERLTGLPEGYTQSASRQQSSGVYRNRSNQDAEASNSYRHALVANAVCVGIAKWLGERLANPYAVKYHPGLHDRRMDSLLDIASPNQATLGEQLHECLLFRAADNDPEDLRKHREGEGPADDDMANAMQVVEDDAQDDLKIALQAVIMDRIAENKVRKARKISATPWDQSTWPKAAYFVRGVGAFAVEDMSETPIIVPFIPLSKFITKVSRPATDEELSTWYERARRHGVMLGPGLRPLFANRLELGRTEITRIDGLLTDAGMVAEVSWVLDDDVFWPAEVIDVSNPPQGFTLSPNAIKELTPAQQQASLPGNTVPGTEKDKRVLALFFPIGAAAFKWIQIDEGFILPFEANKSEKQLEGRQKLRMRSRKLQDRFVWAVEDAAKSLALKNAGNSPLTSSLKDVAQRRAAGAVAALNSEKKRCGYCSTCGSGGTYDCLLQRKLAAALAGHAGAQLSVCDENAIGARISIYWDGDRAYYEGFVAHYDPYNTEHTVVYDDGELGCYKLWQSNERVTVLNAIEEWPKNYKQCILRLRAAKEKAIDKKTALLQEAEQLAAEQAEGTNPPTPGDAHLLISEKNRQVFKFFPENLPGGESSAAVGNALCDICMLPMLISQLSVKCSSCSIAQAHMHCIPLDNTRSAGDAWYCAKKGCLPSGSGGKKGGKHGRGRLSSDGATSKKQKPTEEPVNDAKQ